MTLLLLEKRYLLQMVNLGHSVCFQINLRRVQSKILHLDFPGSFDTDSDFVAQILCSTRVINA